MDARQDRSGETTARRRDAILEVATAHFARDTYHGATLRKIAADCDLAQGHLYYYFRTKEELLDAILNGVQAHFVDSMDRARKADGTATERLHGVLVDHVVRLAANITAVRVSFENLRFLSSSARQVLVESSRRYEDGISALIDEARTEVDIAGVPTAVLTKVVLGIVNWPYQWLHEDGPLSINELATLLADRSLAALA